MSVGVMKDYNLKLRNLRASHAPTENPAEYFFSRRRKSSRFSKTKKEKKRDDIEIEQEAEQALKRISEAEQQAVLSRTSFSTPPSRKRKNVRHSTAPP
jgi:hypothetical protein